MSKIKNMKLRYKIGVGVASTAAVVAAGGAAFAYFSSTGNGTGAASVGSPANWGVQLASTNPTSGTLYPCGATPLTTACSSDQETLTFTITNKDNGAQLLTYNNIKTAIDSATGTTDGGLTDIATGGSNSQSNNATYPTSHLSSSTPVNSCQQAWFGSQVTSLALAGGTAGTSDVDVPGNGTATVVVTVGMEDANAVQNGCANASPDVDLWVS